MKTRLQLAQEQSKIFELAVPLIIGETYTISMNSNEPFMIYVGDVLVGETVDGSLEFVATNTGDVMITSYGDISMEFEIKLELGSTPTKWSPAPEDGYGLDLPNGAYHIQGQGNFSNILDLPNAQSSVDVHNWGDATLNGEALVINETTYYTGSESQLDFNGELDFIARDPSITTSNASPYDGTTLQFSNLELIRNNREENISKLFNEVQGLSYERTTIEYVGDPAIEVGDVLDYLDGDGNPRKIYVTGLEFRDNGAFNGVLHAHILTSEESHSNFVGDYTKNLKTTRIEVDKVNQTVDIILGDVDDLNDKTAQLHIDVDNITSTVENISNGNLLANGSGELGFLGWTGGSVAKYVKEILEARTTDLRYLDNLRYNMGFVPMYNPMSLSESDISFYNNGFDVSPIAFIVPDMEHSYRAKVSKFKPFSVDVLEFNDLNRANALTADKVTNFAFNNAMDYVQFTFTPNATTQYVRFKYNRTGITTSDRLNITEVMFNRGQPKEWQPSPNNAFTYTRSSITQLANEIELKVDTDGVISAINLTSEQAKILASHISLEGLTTINDHFKVLPNGDVEFTNATGTNMTITGTLIAGSIANLQYDNTGITFPNGKLKLNSATNSIDFGTLKLQVYNSPGVGGSYGHDIIEVTGTGNRPVRFGSADDGGTVFSHISSQIIATDRLVPEGSNGANIYLGFHDGANLLPSFNGGSKLGSSSARMATIFLVNQPNVSSDIRYKYDIEDIDPLLIEIIGREVKPKQYRTQFDDKIHFGYIAQDVERALYKYCGHDKDKYAMLHKDESYMSLLYGELNVIIEAYNRKRNDELEERIERLEELLNDTKKS